MHPHRLPGSDVNLVLAAAFVVSLILLLVFTSPSPWVTHVQWQEARPEVHQQQAPTQVGLPPEEAPIDVAAARDGAVS